MRLVQMPPLSPLDWYATDGQQVRAWLEVKARQRTGADLPYALIDVTKYLALTFASLSFGVPALFVLGYQDGTRFIDVRSIDSRSIRVTGRTDRASNDVRPAIRIPLELMATL